MHGRYTRTISTTTAIALCVLLSFSSYAANPPLCPHVIGWNSQINSWAQGAPWIKVIFASDIAPAKATGAKVMYRPFTADTVYWENGYLPDQRTGATYADLVWAQISGLAQKPEAVTYRNEFDWSNTTKAKRTCAEFVNYKNRLRTLGYTGKVIFGSFGPDWVSASTWQDSDLMAAVNASDGVETHEYFDFQVNCCLPNRCFRHRDIAIANNAYLKGKDWYIGEFGSDVDHGACKACGDGQWRTGWRDRNKLTEQQYIDQMKIYRAGCANEVVAVFVFQQGDQTSWSNYEVVGTSVATYMQTTWVPDPGLLVGRVNRSGGAALPDATVTTSPGGYTTQTTSTGNFSYSVPPGTYAVSASKAGYATQTLPGKAIASNGTTVVNFTLYPITTISNAKQTANGSRSAVTGAVTARFPATGTQDTIYVEDLNRSAGLRVAWTGPVAVGDKVDLFGPLGTTTDFERYIAAASVTPIGTASVGPLVLNGRGVAGGALANPLTGIGQSATKAWRWVKVDKAPSVRKLDNIQGLNNLGLLVKVTGKVTLTSDGFFYLDDGSGRDDFESPNAAIGAPPGLKVALPQGASAPTTGSYVAVTGISSCYASGTVPFRLLRVWRPEDIVTIAP
jgi:hypothetical protein